MSVLSVVQDVCAVVGVEIPQSLFSGIAANRTAQEMLALANEMAQRIGYDTRDWQEQVIINYQIAGTGAPFLILPANFKRLLKSGNVWRSTSALYPMRFIADSDEWLQRRALNIYDQRGEWLLSGVTILVAPILQVGQTISFNYLDKNFVNIHGNDSAEGDVFLNDDDKFYIDERLLKLGMIWQWKAQKGSPYAEDMATYSDALNAVAGSDKPAPILIGRSVSSGPNVAYPFPIDTPWVWPFPGTP